MRRLGIWCFVLFVVLVIAVGASAKTTIKVMTSMVVEKPENEAMAVLTEKFKEKFPDIDVEYIGVPVNDIPNQFVTGAIGGEVPDVVFLDTFFIPQMVVELDLLEPLENFFSEDYFKGFFPLALEASH